MALRKELAKLEAGEYRARWLTEGRSSNTVRFTVTADPGSVAPLTIEPLLLEDGNAGDAEVVAYFVNTGGETIELVGAWAASRVLIDGVPYTRAVIRWTGPSGLGPGGSWGVAGVHDVQFEMGGKLSNKLALRKDSAEAKGRCRAGAHQSRVGNRQVPRAAPSGSDG